MSYELKSRAERRARLFIGGTYFRAKQPGIEGNNISIVMHQEGSSAELVVTNHNTVPSENVKGPVTVDFLEQRLVWNEGVTISNLTTIPTAHGYSISYQIGGGTYKWEDLGEVSFSRTIRIPGKLSAKLTLGPPETLAGGVIFITPRCKRYSLSQVSKTSGPVEAPVTETGWDIDALRTAMADDPWVEMLPRGSDPNDTGEDEGFLTPFEDTFLKGGDGMPVSPAGYEVSPTVSSFILASTEAQDGSDIVDNRVFDWNGSNWEPR